MADMFWTLPTFLGLRAQGLNKCSDMKLQAAMGRTQARLSRRYFVQECGIHYQYMSGFTLFRGAEP